MTAIPATSGIYRITCTVTGLFYIGSSVNLYHRYICHFSDLRNGVHSNPKLQNAWNKYGEQSFIFEVVELTLPGIQVEQEQYWLDKLKPFGKKGFNINRKANGLSLPPETYERIRIALLGHSVSETTRTRISVSKTGKTGINLGRVVSPATRAKLSTVNLGKTNAQNISQRKTLIVTSPDGTECLVHGVYGFCKEHHLNLTNLMNVAKGKHSQHKGYKARFPD